MQNAGLLRMAFVKSSGRSQLTLKWLTCVNREPHAAARRGRRSSGAPRGVIINARTEQKVGAVKVNPRRRPSSSAVLEPSEITKLAAALAPCGSYTVSHQAQLSGRRAPCGRMPRAVTQNRSRPRRERELEEEQRECRRRGDWERRKGRLNCFPHRSGKHTGEEEGSPTLIWRWGPEKLCGSLAVADALRMRRFLSLLLSVSLLHLGSVFLWLFHSFFLFVRSVIYILFRLFITSFIPSFCVILL